MSTFFRQLFAALHYSVPQPLCHYFIKAIDALAKEQTQIPSNIGYECIYVIYDVLKLEYTQILLWLTFLAIYLLPQFMLNIGVI